MNLLDNLRDRVINQPRRIVFPEGNNKTIAHAAIRTAAEGLAKPILLQNHISQVVSYEGVEILNPESSLRLEKYVADFCQISVLPPEVAIKLLRQPLYYGCMMVRNGDANAIIAGIEHTTEEVIVAAQMIIGMQESVTVPSSYFVMDIPGFSGPEGSFLVFTDPALNPDPTPEELADIAIACADSVQALLGWIPKVALLSFSTRGSASHPQTAKVSEAARIAQKRRPDLAVDGELQADAAIVPSIASRKIPGGSPVAGSANILVFPNLEAGNISTKLVQQLARAQAYGTVLTGFKNTVSDLSRGSTVEDVIGAVIMASCTIP